MQAVHNIDHTNYSSPLPTKGTNDCKFTVCVPVSVVLATLEQKAKEEHFCTLELQAFSFMLLEGGGKEMCLYVHV